MKPRKTPTELRSFRWFGRDDMRSWGHRSRAKQSGFSAEDMTGKPIIAILNTWSDANPCHAHFRLRAEEVKRGVWQAGGFPMEIPLLTARRDVHEAVDHALSQPAGDGGGRSAARVPGGRRDSPGRLRQDSSGAPHGRDEREPAGDPRPRGADAAGQLARADPRIRQRRLEVLGRAPRRHARRVHVARDGRGHRALVRHVHDDGHGVDDGGGGRVSRHDAAGRVIHPGPRLSSCPHGRRLRPAHRRDGVAGPDAARHSEHGGIRECRHRDDGARRIDQRDHSSDRDGWPRRRGAHARSLRRAVAAHAVHRQHPSVGSVPDGGFLLRGRPQRRAGSGAPPAAHRRARR